MYFEKSQSIIILMQVAFACLPCLASDWEEDLQNDKSKISKPGATLQNASAAKPGKLILHGQVNHSEQLPSLGDGLQAGANFNPNALAKAKYESSWFKIPIWFAGTFQSNESTVEYIKDYATGRSSRPNKTVASVGQEVHGFQQDSHGNIWHFYIKSGSSRSEQTGHITFNNIDSYEPVYVSDDKVVLRVLATSLIVDKRTGIIVDSYRREDIKTYQPNTLASVKVSYTSKSFDSHGQPRDLQDGVSIQRLIARFHPIDSEGDQDYKSMFKDYLSAQHIE